MQLMQPVPFITPSIISYGVGASKQVGSLASGYGKKALIVTDSQLEKIGLLNDIKNSLEVSGQSFSIYNKVVTEPSMEYAQEGYQMVQESRAEFLVAVGGGSVLDTAKAISALAANPGKKVSDFEGLNKIPQPGVPLIAIPTTAGTGSEVSKGMVITDTARNVKMLIASPNIMPRIALVDPLLTLQMPQGITASTGLDALTHAIEGYISLRAQPLADGLALHAIGLIANNIRLAWCNGENIEARTWMMIGALEAGVVMSNSAMALVHGMARPLGAHFHIPHGISNAVLLPTVMEYTIQANPSRYAAIAAAMGENTTGLSTLEAAYRAAQAAKRLNADLKIPTLRGLGVEEKKFNSLLDQLATDALTGGSSIFNPRKATKEEIKELYQKVF